MDFPYEAIIDENRLVELHALGLRIGGVGRGSKAKDGCLAGALGNAWTAEQYGLDDRAEPLGLLFAAHLFAILIRAHCFIDGNKRVAWLALIHVLAHYNVEADLPDVEVRDFCNAFLEPGSSKTIDDVLDWLTPSLKRLDLDA